MFGQLRVNDHQCSIERLITTKDNRRERDKIPFGRGLYLLLSLYFHVITQQWRQASWVESIRRGIMDYFMYGTMK